MFSLPPNRGRPYVPPLPLSPKDVVSVPLTLYCLVPACDKLSCVPAWMPCLSFPGQLWVTLKFPFDDIDLSVLPLSCLYKLNASTIHCHTPLKMSNQQRYSTTWMNLTTAMLSIRSQAHKSRPPVWFRVYKGQKQAKLTDAFRSQVSGYPGTGHEGVLGAGYRVCQKSPSGTLRIFDYSGCRLYHKKKVSQKINEWWNKG